METNGQMTLAGQMNIYDCIAEAEHAAQPQDPQGTGARGLSEAELSIRERPDAEPVELPA